MSRPAFVREAGQMLVNLEWHSVEHKLNPNPNPNANPNVT